MGSLPSQDTFLSLPFLQHFPVPLQPYKLLEAKTSLNNQLKVREVTTDLAVSEAVRSDWSKTLCSAPSAISALGGCAVLSSLPSAATVSLDYGEQG